MLGNYNFECDAPANLPRYVLPRSADDAGAQGSADISNDKLCAVSKPPKETMVNAGTLICAIDSEGKVDRSKHAIAINWQSAKHHLLVMHYCFEAAHDQISTARIWASDNDISDVRRSDFLANADRYRISLDNQATRLDNFMNLVMSERERIQVKYRPAGPFCHVPVLREFIGVFSSMCTPLRTADSG